MPLAFDGHFGPMPSAGDSRLGGGATGVTDRTRFRRSEPEFLVPGIRRQPRFDDGDPLGFLVYTGGKTRVPSPVAPDTPRGFGSERPDDQSFLNGQTIHKLLEDFYSASRTEQRDMAVLLALGGYSPGDQQAVSVEKAVEEAMSWSLSETQDAYFNLLEESAAKLSMGSRLTPTQILKRSIAFRLPTKAKWNGDMGTLSDAMQQAGVRVSERTAAEGEDAKSLFTGTVKESVTSTVRNIMDPRDARMMTRNLLLNELGREPTQAEFEDFVSTLQAAMRENPSKSKTTVTADLVDGEVVDRHTDRTTHAGITGQGLADVMLDKVRSNPNWAEWQAVGTYAPALFAALGATVEGR